MSIEHVHIREAVIVRTSYNNTINVGKSMHMFLSLPTLASCWMAYDASPTSFRDILNTFMSQKGTSNRSD